MRQWLFNYLWSRRGTGGSGSQLESVQSFVLKPNTRYKANVKLTSTEAWFASNAMIEEEFSKLGFKQAKVIGTGTLRKGEALWPGPEKKVPLPLDPHLSDVTEVV